MGPPMTLIVNTLAGRLCKVPAYPSTTVNCVKCAIYLQTEKPRSQQRLFINNVALVDDRRIDHYTTERETDVQLVLCIE